MIKIFRNIRKSLISDGKTSRYFKYAVGEIILVVIGILIALQINNWNENRKNRSYEVKMLSEIKQALQQDLIYFEDMIEVYDGLHETSNYFMELSKQNIQYHDSLLGKVFDLNNGVSYHFNPGPYEALKSSGIDKISNDSIQNKLTELYDFELPKLGDNVNHITRNHQNNIQAMLELFGERYIDDRRGKNFVGWKSIPTDLFQSQGFLQILAGVDWRGINASRQLKRAIPNVQRVINLIENEIVK